MNDTAIALAYAGHALVLQSVAPDPFWYELAEAHPEPWIAFVRGRYMQTLFRPMWGVLFTEDPN